MGSGTVVAGVFGGLVLTALLVPRGRQLTIYYVKTFFMLFWMLVIAAVGLVRGCILRLLGREEELANLNYWTGRLYHNTTWPIIGTPCVVKNAEIMKNFEGPCVIVANHQSSMDIFLLNSCIPPRSLPIAKKSLKHVPFLGWFFTLSQTIFVDRLNHEQAMQSLNNAALKIVEGGFRVVVFPEGTRSRTSGQMLPFKKGAFNLAVAAQVPIVPVVVENQKRIYDSVRKSFPGGTMKLTVLPPIPTKGLKREDVPELADKVRSLMMKEYTTMSEKRD